MGSYRVDPVRVYEIAKPAGGTRRMARLSTRDARTWRTLAGRVVPLLEPRMDQRVLANRAVGVGRSWRLADVGLALDRARGAARAVAARRPMIATDVRAFYPSVRPEILHRELIRAGAAPADARLAAQMLDGWGSAGYPGLPVGPPGSAVVANAILLGVDATLGRAPFLRWVDDYLVPASFPLARLDEAMDRVGLQRSLEKTGPPGECWPARWHGRRYG